MARYDYDLFTIGAGSGGVRASRMSAAFGAFFRTKTMQELYEAACEHRLMLAPANTEREVLASRQLEARRFFDLSFRCRRRRISQLGDGGQQCGHTRDEQDASEHHTDASAHAE